MKKWKTYYHMSNGGLHVELTQNKDDLGSDYELEFSTSFLGLAGGAVHIHHMGMKPEMLRHLAEALAAMATIMESDPGYSNRFVRCDLPKDNVLLTEFNYDGVDGVTYYSTTASENNLTPPAE